MEIKTYSRARAAKAALLKILNMHEVAVDTYNIILAEVEPGRFAAGVDFQDAQPPYILSDLEGSGMAYTDGKTTLQKAREQESEEVSLPPSDQLVDELDMLGVAPRKPTYVSEASTAERPTKHVWAIADSMPGAARKEVIAACREAGIAFGTARTQYQQWYKANKVG